LLKDLVNDPDWAVRASSVFPLYCIENEARKELFDKLKQDENANVRKWVKTCIDTKPKKVDDLDLEYQILEYIRDLEKFYDEIEIDTELPDNEEVNIKVLERIKKNNPTGINIILSKWKKSQSPFLREVYKKIAKKIEN
jgi:hypothetical protein